MPRDNPSPRIVLRRIHLPVFRITDDGHGHRVVSGPGGWWRSLVAEVVERSDRLPPWEREFGLWLSELDRIDAGQRETLNELVLRARAARAAAP